MRNILKGDRNLVSIEKTSVRLPFSPLHQRPMVDVLYKSNFLSFFFFRAERKHIKSVTVNRASDSTGSGPLDLTGKIRALPGADTCTHLTCSNSQSPNEFAHFISLIIYF